MADPGTNINMMLVSSHTTPAPWDGHPGMVLACSPSTHLGREEVEGACSSGKKVRAVAALRISLPCTVCSLSESGGQLLSGTTPICSCCTRCHTHFWCKCTDGECDTKSQSLNTQLVRSSLGLGAPYHPHSPLMPQQGKGKN